MTLLDDQSASLPKNSAKAKQAVILAYSSGHLPFVFCRACAHVVLWPLLPVSRVASRNQPCHVRGQEQQIRRKASGDLLSLPSVVAASDHLHGPVGSHMMGQSEAI